ncbi:hypothetical protein ACJMK2_043952 [Sinanodonta woodiana]|uniref:Uncharacterized protein n=1 Tax=Sinanodonta woodiana TaxID=1069815 RepID=A0ABD3VZA9_SINWO
MVSVRDERKVDLPGYPFENVPDSHFEVTVSVKSVQDDSMSQMEQTLPPKPKPATTRTFPDEYSASTVPKDEEEKERPEVVEEVIEPVDIRNNTTKKLVNVIHVMNALKLGQKDKEKSDSSKQQRRDLELSEIQASEEIKTTTLYEENGHDTVLDNVQKVFKEIEGKKAEPLKHLSQVTVQNGDPDSKSTHKAKTESIHVVAPVPRKVNELDENKKMYAENAKSELKTLEEEMSKSYLWIHRIKLWLSLK